VPAVRAAAVDDRMFALLLEHPCGILAR
jgi:hypothetical protein